MFNHGDQDFEVKMEDKIAQLTLEKISTPKMEEVQALEESVHGSGGFGSIRVNGEKILMSKKKWKLKMNELMKRTVRIKMRL